MQKHTIFVLALVLVAQLGWAAKVTAPSDIPAYWSSVDGKSGSSLWTAVSSATNKGFKTLGYDGLWTAYKTSDVYPSDPSNPDYISSRAGKIWDMYGDCVFTYSSDQCGSYKGVCDCYNREHSIPKSWFGGGTSGIGCDIFHLVPTDGKINGVRSNDEFGVVKGGEDWNGNKSGSAGSWSTDKKTIASSANEVINGSGHVFEPLDKYKGDFARGYFGTIVKWQLSNMTSGNSFFNGIYDAAHYYGLTKKAVVLLMKWHREDPVSQKEIDRNNGIQATQGNRNPFIDYPYLAEYIWGEHYGETIDMSKLIASCEAGFIPGKSDGWRGGEAPIDPSETKYTVTWSANGSQLKAEEVAKNGKISSLPQAPVSCSAESTEFMGWTDAAIAGTMDDAPTPLYTEATEIPAVTADVTYYAVYAHIAEGGSAAPATYTYAIGNETEGWTNNATNKGSYWLLDSGKEIKSPVIDLMGLNKITVRMRTYGGTQYDQLDIYEENGKLASIIAEKGGTLTNYEWTNNLSIAGKSALTFSSNYDANKGIGIASITIDATGLLASYDRYITTCQESTEVVMVETDAPARKMLIGGEIYILVGEQLYNVQGVRVR